MRIIVFAVTLFLGVYAASFFVQTAAPCGNSDSYPRAIVGNVQTLQAVSFDASKNYTKEEAEALVGKEVRNLSSLNAKCPKESGNCLELFRGETGKVVGVIPSMNDTYMLEIRWNPRMDFSNDNYVSYVGKELSIEIIN